MLYFFLHIFENGAYNCYFLSSLSLKYKNCTLLLLLYICWSQSFFVFTVCNDAFVTVNQTVSIFSNSISHPLHKSIKYDSINSYSRYKRFSLAGLFAIPQVHLYFKCSHPCSTQTKHRHTESPKTQPTSPRSCFCV